MKRRSFILLFTLFALLAKGQSDCSTAVPFCTNTGVTFSATSNSSTAPSGPDYGCLGTQPNPAFFIFQIANSGNLTLSLSSSPSNDIDFICWGPFANPNTLCSQLTSTNIVDCSYSAFSIETCQINGANSGDYYIMLITNYSNSPCDINFSQINGNGTTDCCDANAGSNNSINVCETEVPFLMEDNLNASPIVGGDWYNSSWVSLGSNIFNPQISSSGIYAYVVQSTLSNCPDTSYLTINVFPEPTLLFPSINDMCVNDPSLNLNFSTPPGGVYTGNGIVGNIFTPSSSIVGTNVITYSYSDGNGCSSSIIQNITINNNPSSIVSTFPVSCNGFSDGSITINSTSNIITYLWSDGQTTQTASNLIAGTYGYTITDDNGCSFSDSVIVYEPNLLVITLNTTDETCFGSSDGTASIDLQGSSTPSGTVSTLSYCLSSPAIDFTGPGGLPNQDATIEEVILIGDANTINNNTAGVIDYYEDYTTTMYADITVGQSYTVDLILGDISGVSYPTGAKVFIDYNIDGDFNDAGEDIGMLNSTGTSPNIGVINFTVPSTGAFGPTRMRVVSQDSWSNGGTSNIGPCDYADPSITNDVPWFGATEDYSIVLNNPNVSATYLWSTGQITDSISGLSAGNYWVNITDDNGCLTIENFTISSGVQITVLATVDQSQCLGVIPNSLLALGSAPGNNYSWFPSSDFINSNIQNPVFSNAVNITTTYTVTFTDFNGCVATDSVTITVFPIITTNSINHN